MINYLYGLFLTWFYGQIDGQHINAGENQWGEDGHQQERFFPNSR